MAEESIPTTQTQQPPPVEKLPEIKPATASKPKTFLFAFLIILIFILIGVIGFLAYQNNQLRKDLAQSKIVQVKATPTPTPEPKLIWQTYTNSDYKYSVDYPGDWEVLEAGPAEDLLQEVTFYETSQSAAPAAFKIRVLDNPQNKNLDDWSKDYQVPLVADPNVNLAQVVGDATLGGEPAKKILINGPGSKETVFVSLHNEVIYYAFFSEIAGSSETERLLVIFNQILSTFQFVD